MSPLHCNNLLVCLASLREGIPEDTQGTGPMAYISVHSQCLTKQRGKIKGKGKKEGERARSRKLRVEKGQEASRAVLSMT